MAQFESNSIYALHPTTMHGSIKGDKSESLVLLFLLDSPGHKFQFIQEEQKQPLYKGMNIKIKKKS